MNIAFPMILTLVLFVAAYRFYGGYLARILGVNIKRTPPSISKTDHVDFVPTKLGVVFSHHFASIAGGGPILGPTLALIYGFHMSFLWIVVGCILFGAVHDFTALFVSMREDGRSLAEVARRIFGPTGFFLFIAFTVVSLVMIIVAFLGATIAALTSTYPLTLLGLPPDQTLLKTVVVDGVVKGRIGGIASTSVFVITGLAPVVGYLLYVRKAPVWIMSLLAIAISFGSIFVGLKWPVALNPDHWRILLCLYVFLAAGVPVWVLLQPRDFTNSFILYFGIVAIALSVMLGGFVTGPATGMEPDVSHIHAPGFNLAEGTQALGAVWPILFITIACGAISGFHALVAGGTSSKQVSCESHVQKIGYGGMLLEGIFAVGVLSMVAAGLNFDTYRGIVFPTEAGARSNPILAFALSLGTMLDRTVGIPKVYGTVFGILLVEGFVVTTLDTAVRLCRYLLEELWAILFRSVPRIAKSYLFNAGLIVALCYALSRTNTIDKVWPIFGTANQLLAAMVLMVVAAWLKEHGKKTWFAIVPALFMLATTTASLLFLLVTKYMKTHNTALIVADVLLLALSGGFFIMLLRHWLFRADKTRAVPVEATASR